MAVSEAAQSGERVVDFDAIESRMAMASRDDRGDRAACGGLWQIDVAVGRRAAQRDE
jgi:hypothetical protein